MWKIVSNGKNNFDIYRNEREELDKCISMSIRT